ncbi:Toll/interleukin-1 receptor domain-containing protein [Tanacetum coccineum]
MNLIDIADCGIATKCITLRTEEYNADILMKGLTNMKDLRFLNVYSKRHVYSGRNGKCNEVRRCLPNALRFLRWQEVQMPAENLKLISLNVCYSKLKTFHLGITPKLEELSLEGCNDLVELHMPTGCPKLISLDLIGSKLSILYLAITPNLKTLNLEDCKDLVELYIPASLKLKSLNLVSHSKLRILHLGITPNLEMLSLEQCCNLVELHMPFGCLNLRSMDLCQTILRTLDIGRTPNLDRLYLTDCSYLVETFPEEIGRPSVLSQCLLKDHSWHILEVVLLGSCLVKRVVVGFILLGLLSLIRPLGYCDIKPTIILGLGLSSQIHFS